MSQLRPAAKLIWAQRLAACVLVLVLVLVRARPAPIEPSGRKGRAPRRGISVRQRPWRASGYTAARSEANGGENTGIGIDGAEYYDGRRPFRSGRKKIIKPAARRLCYLWGIDHVMRVGSRSRICSAATARRCGTATIASARASTLMGEPTGRGV